MTPLIATGALLLALLAFGCGWAVRTVLLPSTDPVHAERFAVATATRGVVGKSVTLDASADWSTTDAGNNLATGIVTSASLVAGSVTPEGSVLYSVDLRPTVVGQGSIPSFEDVGPGTTGRDVSQVQGLLARTGYFHGRISGVVDAGTESAIKAWQHSLGITPDGIVKSSDVIFVPTLPVRLQLRDVTVGKALSGGEPVLQQLSDAPHFTMNLSANQTGLVRRGMEADLLVGSATWKAVIADSTPGEDGNVSMTLAPKSGSSICANACSTIPIAGDHSIQSTVVVTPKTSGVVVPTAALATNSTNATQIVDARGKPHLVTVLASADGMSAISGVPDHFRYRAGEAVK